jgi:hypothetical protein
MVMKKDQKLEKILDQVFSLEVTKGHLKWSVSDLARLTCVSRPLIYYHLGKTKTEILENSIDLVSKKFYGLYGERPGQARGTNEYFANEMVETYRWLSKVPSLTIFYLKCRMTKSPIQKKLVGIEHIFQKKLARYFPSLDKNQISALHSVLHGIVSAPFASEESVRASLIWLLEAHQNAKLRSSL